MTLQQLRYVIMVAETGTITEAANYYLVFTVFVADHLDVTV